jgi:hypothetical protein
MGRWVIGLFMVAAALAAPSSLAQVVLAQSVFHSADLPSNAITTFTVSCPPRYVAASAGISSPAPGATLLGIRPAGIRAYTFRFRNPAANSDERATVVVACRRFAVKTPVRLKVAPVKSKVAVPAGKLSSAVLLCPPNTLPAGWGEDFARGRSGSFGAAARVSLRRVSMRAHGFVFSLRNGGAKGQSANLYGTCLTVLRSAGASAQLHVRIMTFTTPLHPGTQRVVKSCPSGWASLAAGYALRSRLTAVDGAAAIGARGRWWITSHAEGQTAADLDLVCARLST